MLASLLAAATTVVAGQEVTRRSAVVEAVAAVGPAVVNISTEKRVRNPFADSIFGRSFAEMFRVPEGGYVENSLGSGVIVDAAGYILTNEHVLLGASRITVSLADGGKYEAEVVGSDSDSDLAVIRIHGEAEFPAVPLGTSDDLMIGETVITIGNPLGLSHTVTTGVISAAGRTVRSGNRVYTDFIQTDAPINPGNSGGPLLNILGELIGINTAIVAQAEGIGFAIPIGRARVVLDELVHFGRVREVWLGMDVQATGGGRSFAAAEPKVMVVRSYVDGPADRSGVKPGDILQTVNGEAIRTQADWDTSVRSVKVGETLQLSVDRGGKEVSLEIPAESFPFAIAPNIMADRVGVEIADITPQMRRQATLPSQGVVITGVRPGSPAGRVGLKPGDVIARVNSTRTPDVKALAQVVPRMLERQSVLLVVVRRVNAYYVTIDLR